MSAWFEMRDFVTGYGRGPDVLRGVSLELNAGELIAVIGPNGAGKSTLLRAISGLLRRREGEILLEGERVDGMSAHAIVRRGVAHVPEGRQLFSQMTVRENLGMGAYTSSRTDTKRQLELVEHLFPRLRERRGQRAGSMSGGEQQMLAIGRALMAGPRLLLLDEPSIGLAPQVVKEIAEAIRDISRTADVGVILVEQDVTIALSVATRAYVLDEGSIAFEGEAEALLDDPRVQASYVSI